MKIKCLVTKDDFHDKGVTDLPLNFTMASRMDSCIIQAQMFDIKGAIGDTLLIALLNYTASPAVAEYDNLLDGCQYTYNGNDYLFNGMKETICLYAYHNYLTGGPMVNTEFGPQNKVNDHSEAPSQAQVAAKIKQVFSRANESLGNLREYLSRKSDVWPQFVARTTDKRRINIISIGD